MGSVFSWQTLTFVASYRKFRYSGMSCSEEVLSHFKSCVWYPDLERRQRQLESNQKAPKFIFTNPKAADLNKLFGSELGTDTHAKQFWHCLMALKLQTRWESSGKYIDLLFSLFAFANGLRRKATITHVSRSCYGAQTCPDPSKISHVHCALSRQPGWVPHKCWLSVVDCLTTEIRSGEDELSFPDRIGATNGIEVATFLLPPT